MAIREVIFRGKRMDNGEWIYGDLIQNVDCIKIREQEKDIKRIAKSFEIDPETVGQFTGLTDKNGTMIWEGDIIQSLKSSVTGLVQWFPEHSAFMVWCKSANEVGFLYECADIIKVISNIHDNSELLKGGVN